MLGTWIGRLKGKNRIEMSENYSIVFIIFGGLMLSLGIGLSSFSPRGASAIIAMVGSLIAFLSTVVLVFTWLIKELKGGE